MQNFNGSSAIRNFPPVPIKSFEWIMHLKEMYLRKTLGHALHLWASIVVPRIHSSVTTTGLGLTRSSFWLAGCSIFASRLFPLT